MRSNARDFEFKSDSVDVVPVSEAVAMFGNSTAEGMMSVATDAALLTYCKSNKACDSLLSETEASESAAEHLSTSNSQSSAELNSNTDVGALSD